MKNLNLHPKSALVGAGVVLLAGVLSAQQIANRFVSVRVLETPTLQMAPHPRDFVRIVEGTPYTVPAGRILVVTAMGSVIGIGGNWAICAVNGADAVFVWIDQVGGGVTEIPTGLTAQGADVVDVRTAGQTGVLLGYLVDA